MQNNEENIQATFKSNDPLPWIRNIRKFILGNQKPDLFTRILVVLSFLQTLIFLAWHSIAYVAIAFRSIIISEKQINVSELLTLRGSELGFGRAQFVFHLESFHIQSIIAWLLIMISIPILYRKNKQYFYILSLALILYYSGIFMWMGWNFYMQDTTLFDRITVLSFGVIHVLYFVYLKFFEKENR